MNAALAERSSAERPVDPHPIPDVIQAHHRRTGRLASLALAAKARSGGWTGKAPLGYRNVRRGGDAAVDIDPVLGPAVRDAFYLAARRGSSLRRVAAELAERGVVSRTGKPLSASTLRELLRNPFYLGMVRFKGSLTEGRHAALVCPSVFERAGRALRKRRCV